MRAHSPKLAKKKQNLVVARPATSSDAQDPPIEAQALRFASAASQPRPGWAQSTDFQHDFRHFNGALGKHEAVAPSVAPGRRFA